MGPRNHHPTEISYLVKIFLTKFYGFYVYTNYIYTSKAVPSLTKEKNLGCAHEVHQPFKF